MLNLIKLFEQHLELSELPYPKDVSICRNPAQ
jgi:hypothetical protein